MCLLRFYFCFLLYVSKLLFHIQVVRILQDATLIIKQVVIIAIIQGLGVQTKLLTVML